MDLLGLIMTWLSNIDYVCKDCVIIYLFVKFMKIRKALYTPGMWPVELWTPACSRCVFGVLLYFYAFQGSYCKALSLGNGQSLGETLPVLFQKIVKTQLCYNGLSFKY